MNKAKRILEKIKVKEDFDVYDNFSKEEIREIMEYGDQLAFIANAISNELSGLEENDFDYRKFKDMMNSLESIIYSLNNATHI